MKVTSPFNLGVNNKIVVVAALTLGLMGCALRTINIKTVDGRTGQPLAGVTTVWRQDRYQMFQTIVHSDPIVALPSGQDGTIDISGLHRNWTCTLMFSCPGYSDVYGQYSGSGMTLASKMECVPPLGCGDRIQFDGHANMADVRCRGLGSINCLFLEGENELAAKTNWCFVVKMQK